MKDLKEALKDGGPSDKALELIAKELGIEQDWPKIGGYVYEVANDVISTHEDDLRLILGGGQ